MSQQLALKTADLHKADALVRGLKEQVDATADAAGALDRLTQVAAQSKKKCMVAVNFFFFFCMVRFNARILVSFAHAGQPAS